MSLQGFIQELKSPKNGFQLSKSHLFIVDFSGLLPGARDDIGLLSLLCHQVSLPGQHVLTKNSTIQGLSYEVPVGVQQDDLMCSFYLDRNHAVSQMFDAHMKRVVTMESDTPNTKSRGSYMFRYKEDFMIPEITVKLLDTSNHDESSRAEYHYMNCFIKSIQMMQYDYQNTEIQRVSLIIDFEYILKNFATITPSPWGESVNIENPYGNTIPVNLETIQEVYPELTQQFKVSETALNPAQRALTTIKNAQNSISNVIGGIADKKEKIVTSIEQYFKLPK